ncbi:FAD-dependent oxidoreductase [Marinospirillum insulare]|uniref:Pyridine nucleotide-disulfide oxidoreductase n=1 Tax=Marinospirillum insulare TaxID=217169 RepID=A0ABQ6A1B6_9GAMM|nr:FAD-dependent oxidoreductase [Marinospirillum insulare]GLR64038.1 pyridine nucleotide-disulfide oxidoreductase [Marinospirillum insulare]
MPSTQPTPPLIILGSGMAGYQLATELRRLGDARPITLVTEDSADFYSKPLLSTALAKKQQPEQLVSASGQQQAEKLQLTILPFTRVTAIQPNEKRIITAEHTLDYQSLVIATGARPNLPSIPLAETTPKSKVLYTVNSLEDYQELRQQLATSPSVLIIGGGLIGVEMAQDLLAANFDVTLLARSNSLLDELIPAEAAELLEKKLKQQGLKLFKNTSATQVTQHKQAWQVHTDQQLKLTAQTLICATGLHPRIRIASEAGIATNKGILVDQQLKTNMPDIYALGDCAEITGLNLMYVQPMMASARVLAARLTGDLTAKLNLQALPILIKTPSCPVVAAPPAKSAEGSWQYEKEADSCIAEFKSNTGQLLGFALVGKAVRQKTRLTKALPPLIS